jgi:hypothetical protein
VTCRRTAPVSRAPDRAAAHREQHDGSCRTTRSGWSLSRIVAPGRPFGRPGFRPDFPRRDFGAGFASPSDDGGPELFFEFYPALAAGPATCACHPATSSRKAATSPSRCQQPPQPRVHRAQVRSGIIRRIGHDRHYTTAARTPQIDEQPTRRKPTYLITRS